MAANLRAELQFALALIERIEAQASRLRWRRSGESGDVGCELEGFSILIGAQGDVQIDDAEGGALLQVSAAAFSRAERGEFRVRIDALQDTARAAAHRIVEPLEPAEQARLAQLVTRLKPTARREARPLFERGWSRAAAHLSGYLPGPRPLPQGGVAQDGVDIRMAGAPA